MKKILYILLLGAIISSCSKFDGDDYAIDIFADLPIVTKYPIASDIYDTQVKFSGSISESQTGVTVAGFYISQEKELLGEDLAFEAPEIVDFEFSTWIDGLERDTRYYACAYGVAGDEIIIGNTVTFATSTDEIPNVKFEGKAYVEASNAIDVSIYCNIDEEEGANREQIRQYGIKYWLDNEEEAQSVAINYGDSNFYYDTGKGLLVPITNILPNTQYNYRFFAYSTPTIDIREPQEGDETMEGTECVKPTLTDFDAQFVGNSMIRVIATVADTGNDPTVEYGFRVTAGSSETVDYKLSPVYDDDTRTSNDTDYTYLIDNLASAQDVVVEAYITNTILRDYGTEGEVYEATEEKTFTTTDVDESVWTLSQFSDVSYPTTDNWVIMQGTDYVASSTVFDGFKAALRALWKSAPEREISVTLLDFDSIPGSAIGFGTSESDWTYNLVEVTLSSATIVYGTTVQYAQGLRKFSAPYAVSMKNQAISHNPALEVIELPRMVTIDGYRTLYDNLSLKRVNSDVDGEVNFPELTTINNVDLLSNSAATASPYITSVSMPKLETVAITSGSIIGTDTYLQLESLSMPVLTDGTCVFTTANTTLTEVDMPELTAIPDEAFEGNTNLTQLNFPKLVSVGQEAFKNCTNLTSICGDTSLLPESVVTIGAGAFNQCDAFASALYLPNVTSIGNNAFDYCDNITSVEAPLLETLGTSIFRGCPKLTSAKFESLLTISGNNALLNCSTLTEVYMPNLKSITATTAFAGCALLEEIDLPSLETITSSKTLYNSPCIERISMPNLTTLTGADNTFGGCKALKYVNSDVEGELILDNLTSISAVNLLADSATNTTLITSVSMPLLETIDVTSGSLLGSNAEVLLEKISMPLVTDATYLFTTTNTNISQINMPALTSVPASAFTANLNLTDGVNLPNLVSVGDSAFSGCTYLSTICTEEGVADFSNVATIGSKGFYNCKALASEGLYLPAATSIGDQAFEYCDAMPSVEAPLVETLGKQVFRGCKLLESVKFEGLKTITGANTLHNNSSLTSVYMPNLTSITGTETFHLCSILEEIDLPSLQSIEATKTFYKCYKLAKISLPSLTTLTGGGYTFAGCTLLSKVNSEIEGELVLDGLTSISADYLLSDASSTTTAITSVSMAQLETIEATTSMLGTDAYLLLTKISMPLLKNGTYIFTRGNIKTEYPTLTEVDMPELTTVPDYGFKYHTGLTKLNFPKLESIGTEGFAYCLNLTKLCGDDEKILQNAISVGAGAFNGSTVLTGDVYMPNATYLGNNAFSSCPITSAEAPQIKTLYASTFSACTSLTTAKFEGVTSTGGAAVFTGCSNLTTVDLPLLETISYDNTFTNCTSIEKISLPSFTSNGTKAVFKGCTSLKRIYLDSMVDLTTNVINCTGLTALEYVYMPKLETYNNANLVSSTVDNFTLEVATASQLSSFGTAADILSLLTGPITLVTNAGGNGTTVEDTTWTVPYSGGETTYTIKEYISRSEATPYIPFESDTE